MAISHRTRLENTLSGEKPDRIPVALWHHFPVDDQNPTSLANATIAFQNRFDFDFVKVMPTSSFCLKDWGIKDKWQGNIEGTRTYTKRAIQEPEDWLKLKVLDPLRGHLGDQLKCLEILQDAFTEQIPFIQTIFNPLSQVKNLLGDEQLCTHLRVYPDALHRGLETITETTIRFIETAKTFGIAGTFFAIQHASFQILSTKEYEAFGKRYDLEILESVKDLWLNMVHIHGSDIMFDLISDYPVQIINWHDQETKPSLSEGLNKFQGTVCGGLGRIDPLVLGNMKDIKEQAKLAYKQTKGKRLILSTGCVVPLNTPYGNILAARQSVEDLA